MTARRRIVGLLAAGLVTMLALLGLAGYGLWSAGHLIARIDATQQRTVLLSALATDAGAYGEKAAMVLLAGRDELDALGAARITLERRFADVAQATRREIATLTDMQKIQDELPEIGSVRRMLELYHAIDMATNQALSLQRRGQHQEAIDRFRRGVTFRIANELEPQLQAELTSEAAEIGELKTVQEAMQTRLWIAAAIVLALGLAVMAALGVGLARSLGRSLAALEAGARALAAGDLDQPIATGGSGRLAGIGASLAAASAALKARIAGLERAAHTLTAERDGIAGQRDDALARLADIDSRRAQFIADIGHELRTPLTILRGEADVALRGPAEPAAQREALERIQGQAAELGAQLEDMIAYARSDGEGQPEAIEEQALAEIVRAAAQEGQLLAEPREIAIALELRDEGARIEADFRRLRQALLIGIDNAVKHSAPGGRIAVATARGDGQALVRILDDGPGVAPEDRARVFERFFRGHGEVESLAEGLGIGLAIAREIVERHGGAIRLDNRPEGGAVLEIALPLAGARS